MLFRDEDARVLAISQLTHAWISGQILRAWDEKLGEPLLLAAEQHDIGWLDWETAPTFNPQTGRPHLFREVGAATHAPMWTKGVERARGAWGAHVALLILRHGGVIYRRYLDRHRMEEADAVAADQYLADQSAAEKIWAKALGLDQQTLARETALIALADTLSLAVCGELKTPLELHAPQRDEEMTTMRLVKRSDRPFEFACDPWPFREDSLILEGEARPLPREGRFSDEAAMQGWLAESRRVIFQARLAR